MTAAGWLDFSDLAFSIARAALLLFFASFVLLQISTRIYDAAGADGDRSGLRAWGLARRAAVVGVLGAGWAVSISLIFGGVTFGVGSFMR